VPFDGAFEPVAIGARLHLGRRTEANSPEK
jgi:hypothetical protein